MKKTLCTKYYEQKNQYKKSMLERTEKSLQIDSGFLLRRLLMSRMFSIGSISISASDCTSDCAVVTCGSLLLMHHCLGCGSGLPNLLENSVIIWLSSEDILATP